MKKLKLVSIYEDVRRIQINSYADAQKYTFKVVDKGRGMTDLNYELVDVESDRPFIYGNKQWLKSQIAKMKLNVVNMEKLA